MKIAVLTLPLNSNYGGILQAYALQTVLERMGHHVTVFDHFQIPQQQPLWRKPFALIRRTMLKYIFKKQLRVFQERYEKKVRPLILRNMLDFMERHLHRVTPKHYCDLRKDWNFDAVIVGSDQVWRKEYFPEKIENAFLDFVKDKQIQRISYAASFGLNVLDFTQKEIINCGKLLRMFDAVSVRETSGIKICKERLGVEAQQVLDPALLLKKEDYVQLIEEKMPTKSRGTLMVSILDLTDKKQKMVGVIAKQCGLTPFHAVRDSIYAYDAPLNKRIMPSVESWLQSFRDAELVITDSFHACVFSIIFHKPFIALGNKARGMSRFVSLLSLFGLENRLVKMDGNLDINSPINWKDVDRRLEKLRAQSFAYLQGYLLH